MEYAIKGILLRFNALRKIVRTLIKMATSLPHALAGAARWLRKEFVAILPVFLFFLVGFVLLILLIKLALAQFSVEITVLSHAVIGALLAAKAALILDETPLARVLSNIAE